MGDLYVSDALVYEWDIEPYPLVAIYAGVGSGKTNYFIKLAKGEIEGIPAKTILLITSRRSKVNETKADKTLPQDDYIGQNKSFILPFCETEEELESILASERTVNDPDWGEEFLWQRSVTCTNAAIENYLAKHYNENDLTSFLWNRFDLIILDESHSVRADASYQSAPFYVQRLINVVQQLKRKGETQCNAVVMTGTPDVISDYGFPSDGHKIDLREECRNVVPERVCFVTAKQAKKKMLDMLQNGERGIYFFNHVKDLLKTHKDICTDFPSLANTVEISFSKQAVIDKLEKENPVLYKRIKDTEKTIETTSRLPENTTMFFSTEKNKEGINIEDKDIHVMFVEAHVGATVMQMAGRVRNGLKTLYIIVDSSAHKNSESTHEWSLTSRDDLLTVINLERERVFKAANYNPETDYKGAFSNENVKAYIEYIHAKFPYIRYDYFKHCFCIYNQRDESIRYYEKENRLFNNAKRSPQGLVELAKTWFPDAEIIDEQPSEARVETYLTGNGLLDTKIGQSQINKLREFLLSLKGEKYRSNASINTLLKKYGYALSLEHRKDARGTIRKLD